MVLRRGSWKWVFAALGLALMEIFAVQSVAIGTGYSKCLYDDDCKLGTVCAYLHTPSMPKEVFFRQAICVDCNIIFPWPGKQPLPDWFTLAGYLFKPRVDGFQMSPARDGVNVGIARKASEYCRMQLDSPSVKHWSNATNFDTVRQPVLRTLNLWAADQHPFSLSRWLLTYRPPDRVSTRSASLSARRCVSMERLTCWS